ncbi:MAG TPA: alkaline phosphatase D family protein [Dehalococcoidia bacterium]|nr:alkaline phosphatase D family protein [Dehalococcoidia bacterium]
MTIYLPPRYLRLLRFLARASSLATCAIFAYLAIQRGPPAPPEGPGLERDIQYAFLLLAMVATAAAWRYPGFGGGLLTLSGAVLGVAAASRFSPETALAVALMFILPGVLFLALWGSGRAVLVQLAAFAFVAVVLVAGGREAQTRHEVAFGPAHPESALAPLPVDRVQWLWAGATTPTSFEVRAKLARAGAEARLVVSTRPGLEDPVYSAPAKARPEANRVVALRAEGLRPATTYYYGVEVEGRLDAYQRGEIETFPAGPASFTIAFASCARTGSNGAVFDAIRAANPLLYLITGDMHYENIESDDRGRFREAYDRVLGSPAQSALYRTTSIAYVWDDHDFGGNNSDASSPSKKAARLSYRENVPHYHLPAGDGNGAIYQAFSVGRVRVVMVDTRSERGAESAPGGGKSLLGSEQRAWLKEELLSASRSHSLVVWVSPVPWISGSSSDDWSAFASERREIADFIASRGIRNVVMLAGDAHMVALDDGSNSNYAASGSGGFPVFHAAALDRPGSVKGGPYSHGSFPGAGQFGLLDIKDDGRGPVRVTFRGLDYTGRELVSYTFTPPVAAAATP